MQRDIPLTKISVASCSLLLQLCGIIPCLHHVVDVRVFSERVDHGLVYYLMIQMVLNEWACLCPKRHSYKS